MKKSLIVIGAAALLAVALSAGLAMAQYSSSNYSAQGGSSWNVGAALNVLSGGSLDIKAGGALKVAGTDVTATLAAATQGVAGGYKVARGETALDGANPTPVTTGLTTIVACSATIKSTATPGVSTSVVTYDTSAGTLNLYGWKVTNSSTTTMIASAGTDTIGWVCVGT